MAKPLERKSKEHSRPLLTVISASFSCPAEGQLRSNAGETHATQKWEQLWNHITDSPGAGEEGDTLVGDLMSPNLLGRWSLNNTPSEVWNFTARKWLGWALVLSDVPGFKVCSPTLHHAANAGLPVGLERAPSIREAWVTYSSPLA